MDYSSDELVTATITLSVDWMEVGWNKLSRHTSEPNWKQYSDPAAIQAQRLAADSHYDVSRVAMGGDAVDNVIEMNIDMLSEEDILPTMPMKPKAELMLQQNKLILIRKTQHQHQTLQRKITFPKRNLRLLIWPHQRQKKLTDKNYKNKQIKKAS